MEWHDPLDPPLATTVFSDYSLRIYICTLFKYCLRFRFVSEKLAEATRKFANLQSDLREAQDDKVKSKESGGNLKPVKRKILRKNTTTRKTQELKLAFSEFYLSLILLQNYQNLNYTGFRKIMKKHDKVPSIIL